MTHAIEIAKKHLKRGWFESRQSYAERVYELARDIRPYTGDADERMRQHIAMTVENKLNSP